MMPQSNCRSRVGSKPQLHRRAGIRPAAISPGLSPPNPARREGVVEFGKRTSTSLMPVVSSVEESSFTLEFEQGSKKAKGMPAEVHEEKEMSRECFPKRSKVMPMKMPAGEETGKELEVTHSSPCIVARLMGLDTMPCPEKVHKQCHSSAESDMAHASCEDHSCQNSSDELPELKDVFEITEMANMKLHETLKVRNEKPSPQDNEAVLDFIRQKFMDIKRLCTDEAHRISKEFSEPLEILYSKKDIFLEFLQEPNSQLSGLLHDYNRLQLSPHKCKTSTVKSSKDNKLHNTEIRSEQEREHQGIFHPRKEVKTSSPKPEDCLCSQDLKDNYQSLPMESSEPWTGSKNRFSRRRSIYVIKPNLEKGQSATCFSSQEAFQFDYRSCTQFLKPLNQSLCKEDGTQPMSPDNVAFPEPEAKNSNNSRELHGKITKQTTARANRTKASETENCCTIGNERYNMPFASCDNSMDGSICSSIHSTGSSVSIKAIKHLSERWKITRQFPAEASTNRGSSRLGELRALADKETPRMAANRKASVKNFTEDNVEEAPDCPLGISSQDGWKEGIHSGDDWKDGIPKTFSRSKSLPSSFASCAKSQCRKQFALTGDLPILKKPLGTRSDDSGSSHITRGRSPIRKVKRKNNGTVLGVGKENMLPEKDIHVNSGKVRNSICITDLSGACPVYHAWPDDVISMEDYLVDATLGCQDERRHCRTPERQPGKQVTVLLAETNEHSSIHNKSDQVLEEGTERHVKLDIIESNAEVMQSASFVSSENHECSTPTSLQQHLGEEIACSGFFKSINADIEEFRLQLQFLKMGRANAHAECSDLFLNDEDNRRDTSAHQSPEDMLRTFKDDNDRDFFYVRDMLASSWDCTLDAASCKVGSDVFLKLEKKYSSLMLWSRADRKLLFDLVNSVLADMTVLCSNLYSRKVLRSCCSKLDLGQLAEHAWQAVLEKRKDWHCTWERAEVLPFDSHSEFEMIAQEVAEVIQGDLLKEYLAELMAGRIDK